MKIAPILIVLITTSVLVVTTALILIQSEFAGTTVYLAGDSTMAIQSDSKRPATGWGEPFALMMCDKVRVINYAQNGRSTKSYLTEKFWQSVVARVRKADVVLIQFGHNDQKIESKELYTDAWQAYRENLRRFVTDVRLRGATPVLLTSIVRLSFDDDDAGGNLQATLGDYPAALRSVAEELHVTLIDLNQLSREILQELGPEASKALYVHIEPGLDRNFPLGKQDDTHLSARGASTVAKIAALALRKTKPELFCW